MDTESELAAAAYHDDKPMDCGCRAGSHGVTCAAPTCFAQVCDTCAETCEACQKQFCDHDLVFFDDLFMCAGCIEQHRRDEQAARVRNAARMEILRLDLERMILRARIRDTNLSLDDIAGQLRALADQMDGE